MTRVRIRDDRYWIDRRQKLGSLIPNEIVLYELRFFLDRHFAHDGGSLLDIGAGTEPYAPVYQRFFSQCTSVDVPYSLHDVTRVDVLASAEDLPFADRSFDCIVCTEVLEHCTDPRAVMREMERVLRPDGMAFLTTPFLVPEHEMPHDYYRFTPSALRLLAEEAGLTVVEIRPKGDYVAVAFGMLMFPWSKLWDLASRRLNVQLYHPYNPLVFFPVVLPQLVYVKLWKRIRRTEGGLLNRLHARLSYVTLGYVTTLAKLPKPDQ